MNSHIPEDKIEEIKSRANIVDLVSEYVILKKAGRNFVGLCPFHKEKTPSFTVNPEKQIFYCFGCGEGGNIFTFLMKINNISFIEAVRYLAGKLGVVITTRRMSAGEKESISIREGLKQVNRAAAGYFSENLFSEAGRPVREYLKKRGLKDSVIKEFNLGYAANEWTNLGDFFKRENISLKLVEEAGLIIPRKSGGFYDRFRGRLIFPIEDIGGNIVAFGGRILGDGEPKYLNSPESPIYVKGKNLYGLNRTKDDIRKNDYVILVEGYFDLLSLKNSGISNIVATLGTAVTRDHVDLIRRYTRNLVVMFDPDEGGISAMERSLKLFLEGNLHTKVVVLPDSYDPDECVRKLGREALDEAVAHSQSMVDYYIEEIIGSRKTFEENLDLTEAAISFISSIGDVIQRNLFIKRVSERLNIDQELLKRETNRKSRPRTALKEDVSCKRNSEKVDALELSFIHMMLEYPHKIPEIANGGILDYFTSEDLMRLVNMLKQSYNKNGDISASDIVSGLEDGALKKRLLKLIMSESPYDVTVVDKIFADLAKRIKQKWYKKKHIGLKRELIKAQEMDDRKSCNMLLVEKQRLLTEEREKVF